MNHSIILPFLVFFPMLGGIIGYIIGRKNKNARDYWAMLVTLLTFGASLLLIGKEEAFHETGICGLGLHLCRRRAASHSGSADWSHLVHHYHLF